MALSKGAIAGIVIACIVALVVAGVLTFELWFKFLNWGATVVLSMTIPGPDDTTVTRYVQMNQLTMIPTNFKTDATPFAIVQPSGQSGYLKSMTPLLLKGGGAHWLTTMLVNNTTWVVGSNTSQQAQRFQLMPVSVKPTTGSPARITTSGGKFLLAHLDPKGKIDGYVTLSNLDPKATDTNNQKIFRIMKLDPDNLDYATFNVG